MRVSISAVSLDPAGIGAITVNMPINTVGTNVE